MALLGNWTESLGHGGASDLRIANLVKHQAAIEHRHLQPVWEHRVRDRRTALLGEPIGTDLTVADLLTDHRSPETETLLAELADSRLLAVLRSLAADEQALARAWADSGDTWNQTALDAGPPPGFGERGRRRLKRLGTRHTERTLAAAGAAR
ncbi:hypothetical protein GCM10009639_09410 [Kitasatospora putterlickiae]|uniref:Uncharacterized protein n=1 Tax=Kitasatospora putterlickiae TaxID=221725 RepID=A0ABN1XU41_9ACTN